MFLLAAPLLLYFVARTALMVRSPELASQMPPASGYAQLRQAAASAANPKYEVDRATLDLAARSAEIEPLDFLPFFVASRAAEQRGDFARALQLMEEARRRNATRMAVRIYLVALYYRAGRIEDATREIDFVLRHNERARMALLPELVKLASLRQGRPYVGRILADDPPWKSDFFAVAREQKLPPDAALDLLRMAQARGGDVAQEEQLYVSALMQVGQAGAARERWLATLPQGQRAQNRFVSNGDFSRNAAPGEFEWKLSAVDVGRADIARGGAGQSRLTAQYFGGSPATLAEQQIALPPGRYRLTIAGQANTPATAGQLAWTISCHPGGPELLRMPVAGFTQQASSLDRSFNVPGGTCRGQTLRLVGEPGEMSVPTEAEFSRVAIDAAR